MEKYQIKQCNLDFEFVEDDVNMKGTREKRLVIDMHTGEKAMFKYERTDYNDSESCSEKLCCEIAKILNYEIARIEFAEDESGKLGILNYLFVNLKDTVHEDADVHLKKFDKRREKFYTIENIKNTLDKLNPNLFKGFVRIMFFDALVGETDRHEENWGVRKKGTEYIISPLYDNGCNLLREFKNINKLKEYFDKKDFESYILRSKTLIYKNGTRKKYKHFELINYFYDKYPRYIIPEIKKLDNFTDNVIEEIVYKIPDKLLTLLHKQFIIKYLKARRDILLKIDEWV